jgi:hypothetical protein
MICINKNGVLMITDEPDCVSAGMDETMEIADIWEDSL